MKLIKTLIIVLTYLIIFSKTAAAVSEFSSKYDVSYTVSEEGNTFVDQQITITNLHSNLFPTKSVVTLGSANIYNISAYDNIGKIFIKITKENEQTKVTANFNEKIVGIGKKYVWHLKYETPDLVSINGQLREVNISKLELESNVDEYNLTVDVPKSFGPVLYEKPTNSGLLKFTKDDLLKGPVSIAFGKYQIFNFFLKYNLSNDRVYPVNTDISLPPDTDTQNVFLNSLNPKPVNVVTDIDGNWIAKYKLAPGEKLEIEASGSAQLFISPKETINYNTFGKTKVWLNEQKYWETANPTIRNLAQKLKTPREIYDYVTAVLRYDYDKIIETPARMGAVNSLKNTQSAICMEFTDLFIAIARAAGIPARENNGYAYTNNPKLKPLSLKKDILHSWPEYFDPEANVWRQIDPTWANTTGGLDYFNILDVNHFIFVKRGVNSEYPYPAGAYKNSDGTSKDVEISFGNDSDLSRNDSFTLNLSGPDTILSGLTQTYLFKINNTGNTKIKSGKVNVSTGSNLSSSTSVYDIEVIPPFGYKELNISLKPDLLFADTTANVTLYYNNQKLTKLIKIRHLPVINILLITPFILILAAVYYFALYAKHKNKK